MSFFEGSVIKYTITHNIVIMLPKNPKSLNIEHNKKKKQTNKKTKKQTTSLSAVRIMT